MSNITMVMYHYVRDYKNTAYPKIKGMDIREFEQQVQYLTHNFNVIGIEDIIEAIEDKKDLPKECAVLTFDDGYSDHYEYVLPILEKYGVKGAFYIPTGVLANKKVLDVNKIHYILASANSETIYRRLVEKVKLYQDTYNLKSLETYREEFEHPNRWDTKEVIFIKRMLQRALPDEIRHKILDELFEEFIDQDEASFSEYLYMSQGQIEEMHKLGMHFGPHTHNHVWLDSLQKDKQEEELTRSIQFLNRLGIVREKMSVCYPYGGYNEDTLSVMEKLNMKIGVTVEPKVWKLNEKEKFIIPRLDCNDIRR